MKKHHAQLWLLLLLTLVFTGCSDSTPSKPSSGAQESFKRNDSATRRLQVRAVVLEHFKKYYSAWEVKGVSVEPDFGNTHYAVVDAVSNDNRQTFDLRVGLFMDDSGNLYWKTDFLPARETKEAKPFDFAIAPYVKDDDHDDE